MYIGYEGISNKEYFIHILNINTNSLKGLDSFGIQNKHNELLPSLLICTT